MNPWNTTFHDLLAFNDHYVYFRDTHIPVDPSEGVIVEYSSALLRGQKAYLYPHYFYSKAQLFNNRGEVLGTYDHKQGVSSRKILCDSRFPPAANSVTDTGAISPETTNEE